jgi:hypothetical protein
MMRISVLFLFSLAACSNPSSSSSKSAPIDGKYAAGWTFENANMNDPGVTYGTANDTITITTSGETITVARSGYSISPQKSGPPVRKKMVGGTPGDPGVYNPDTRAITGSGAIREIRFDEGYKVVRIMGSPDHLYKKFAE